MPNPISGVGGAVATRRPPLEPHARTADFAQVLGERAGPSHNGPAPTPRPGAEAPAPARGPAAPAPAARRLLVNLVEGERRLDQIIAATMSGRNFTVQQLIAIQATVFRYTQELEVVSRVVDKATAAVKTTLQTQV